MRIQTKSVCVDTEGAIQVLGSLSQTSLFSFSRSFPPLSRNGLGLVAGIFSFQCTMLLLLLLLPLLFFLPASTV